MLFFSHFCRHNQLPVFSNNIALLKAFNSKLINLVHEKLFWFSKFKIPNIYKRMLMAPLLIIEIIQYT